MAKPRQTDFISQLDQLANGKSHDVAKISWPRRLNVGSPEYIAARKTIAKLRQDGNTGTALALARLFSASVPQDRPAKLQLARILWADRKSAEAAKLLDKIGPAGADHEWFSVRAAVSNAMGKYDRAMELTALYREAAPMVITQKNRRELPIVAILNGGPELLTMPLLALPEHFRGNFVSQYANSVTDRFRFASYWVNTRNLDMALRTSPVPDVLINNIVSGELVGDPEKYPQLKKCIRHWGMDCINKPEHVRETARDKLASALYNSQRIITPKTRYFKSSDNKENLVDQVKKEFDYPFIVRAPFFQNGAQMYLVENRTELLKLVPTLVPGFFAIEFVKNLHHGGLYRKMRGAFIQDEFFMLRVDYGPDWMIHGHREKPHRIEFYEENPQFLKEEIAICKDPNREFGKPVMRALRELRSVVKLDYFGVDFDITQDGKVIVYEANAAMNFLNKLGDVNPHPKESGDAITECFTKFLMSKIKHPKLALSR